MILQGGMLELRNFANHTGKLDLQANSVLDLSAGGSIAFRNSSAEVWNPEATLQIKGALGKNRVRFGEDALGLSETQLRQIRCEEGAVSLRADGFLMPSCKTTILFLQ